MKVKVNIELLDNSPKHKLEEIGLTEKFLEICYKSGYEEFAKSLCEDADGLKYTVSVEVEDNTVN